MVVGRDLGVQVLQEQLRLAAPSELYATPVFRGALNPHRRGSASDCHEWLGLGRARACSWSRTNPYCAALFRSVLGQAGFNVIAASSGDEALRLIKARHDVCAVVSDATGLNGFELVRRIRQVRSRVGIVLVSGETVPTGDELPYGVLFLSKPFRAVTLLRLLRQLVGSTLPEPLHYSSG